MEYIVSRLYEHFKYFSITDSDNDKFDKVIDIYLDICRNQIILQDNQIKITLANKIEYLIKRAGEEHLHKLKMINRYLFTDIFDENELHSLESQLSLFENDPEVEYEDDLTLTI